ncbi:acetyl/propionyl/methylcrotonyl-CoA carboxylase subunit alpha [Nocardioides lianchengensis]|uniref:Propionyl-CoA carboxylase alpha chain n=1 Tax=Nocardioides lianchengensis TaxID=1045774 RepID=A0A1G6L2B4_9ACTN|nr:biotin carboxylase N-terminal domain-containing protein [Nocardioides lianchengensis]NYG12707.1 propionyl-CoA carboxylase alpha chain [Nocardioides lianchengensis]SDC37472.1 propionyl-CoA carboxylase alpha chain [Nocardioides lianchengensis]
MIQRLLVANRAEIASRVFRTCRRLGIETVAIHSDADADLPYVREADHAVRLPGSTPAETYLRTDLVVEAAKRAGADAIHPGYGFLSENADFARAVQAVGLTWVGPHPDAIDAMGSKIAAKRIMATASVPVLEAPDEPTEADLPLIVKASAGGGGRGMRIVRTLAELPGELERARAEAASAFGDDTVFVEPYVERGRHVEVQVLGTPDGVIVLGERDCSLQRRHQKVVEESPAPGLSDPTREALHDAGRAAAAAIDYLGAGTVEFLYDAARDTFFFLEMNTRLQVEHPVTELVHGVDLVELQLAVAEGGVVTDPSTGPTGHAIEVRLYAEDPAADYQPQSGLLTVFELPTGDGLRVDAGFESGSTVSTHYDAMLAKVVAHAPTREQAARKLAGALRRARIHGLTTNRDQLLAALADPGFLAGEVSTAFLDELPAPVADEPEDSTGPTTAAALALAARAGAARTVQRGLPVAWRNVPSQPQRTEFESGTVEWWGGRSGYRVDGVEVVAVAADRVTLGHDGLRTSYDVTVAGDRVDVDWPGGHLALRRVPRFTDPADAVASGSLLAPMPGTVVQVAVEAGQQVEAGQPVLVLEAMKMQHTVSAPHAGTVAEISVEAGSQVAAGEVLAVVEETA